MSEPGGDPCMGLLLSRGSAVQRMFLSFVSFLVRSESPFLRPDPQQRQAVARRSCQGWPLQQPFDMPRPCMGLLLSRGSAVQRMFLSFVSFLVRSESPFLGPDPQQRQAVARRSCQGWPLQQPFDMPRPCMGLLLSRGSAVQRMFLSFVSFLVRSESPFLGPDPQQRQAVARRSCQGWPLQQPFDMPRP